MRDREEALEAVLDIALDMEEPLRHATQFIRVVELAHQPHDEEMEAIAFVALEARMRLETVQDSWRKLLKRANRK